MTEAICIGIGILIGGGVMFAVIIGAFILGGSWDE